MFVGKDYLLLGNKVSARAIESADIRIGSAIKCGIPYSLGHNSLEHFTSQNRGMIVSIVFTQDYLQCYDNFMEGCLAYIDHLDF